MLNLAMSPSEVWGISYQIAIVFNEAFLISGFEDT
jgi:hypothetical protein